MADVQPPMQNIREKLVTLERNWIAALWLQPSLLESYATGEKRLFFDMDMKDVYVALQTARKNHDVLDKVTALAEMVELYGREKTMALVTKLESIAQYTVSTNHAVYAKSMRENHMKLHLAQKNMEQMELLQKGGSLKDLIASSIQTAGYITTALERDNSQNLGFQDTCMREFDAMTTRIAVDGVDITYGLPAMDSLTYGLVPGQLAVFAAATGQGKSLHGLMMAHAAAKKGKKVLFVNMEMQALQVGIRLAAMEEHISQNVIDPRKSGAQGRAQFAAAMDKLAELPLDVVSGSKSLEDIRMLVIAQREAGAPYDLVIVDYLQRTQAPVEMEDRSRVEIVRHIAHGLKSMALDYGCAIMALAQLNRDAQKAKEGPQMYHIRECGDIEHEADVVWLMWPDTEGTQAPAKPPEYAMFLQIAKNRNGEANRKLRLITDRARIVVREAVDVDFGQ